MKVRQITSRRLTGLAARISLSTLAIAALVILVLAIGIFGVARSTFDALMVHAGETPAAAQTMFDEAVARIFVVAIAVAAAVSAVLAVLLAVRIARPLDQVSAAAQRIASGDYAARAPRRGPAELCSLADSFNRMAASLEDQERVRRDFIVNAAHELRTPLTNLQGYLEALRDGVVSPTPEQFVSLHEEVQRLVRLAHSLDSLAESIVDVADVTMGEVDLTQALRTAADMARPSFDAKGIAFKCEVPTHFSVRGDPDRLAQVLSNLLQNAARYTPEAGSVRLSAEASRSEVTVTVTNSGEGIPEADLPLVFERFYRVEKSRDAARGGAGIGLAIVKQLVEAAGGQVGADSRPGCTRFWFRLPALASPDRVSER